MVFRRLVMLISICLLLKSIVNSFGHTQIQAMLEICDNAIDDDMDGLIDLNDDDCTCIILEPTSLIPNPSFEDMNCCPSNRSQLDCAEIWIQASQPTTDYIHTCGWLGWEEFPAPMPFPDGDAIMGFRDGRAIFGDMADGAQPEFNWKEYAGACLLGPLKANDSYRFEFFVGFVDSQKSPDINITFFGSTDCSNLPFGAGNDAFGCPTNGPNWVKLGSTRMGSITPGTWKKGAINVVPDEDIQAIVIGPDCARTSSSESTYYFFDELVLADTRAFDFIITELDHPCSETFGLSIPFEENSEYQWYKEGVALLDETENELTVIPGEGNYQVRVIDDGSCAVLKPYNYTIPVIRNSSTQVICETDQYTFGSSVLFETGEYIDTFKNHLNCDSIVLLTLDVRPPSYDTVQAKIFEGETYSIESFDFNESGTYTAQLMTNIGCDSLVLLELDFYEVYVPTAFSPNRDGINDTFTVLGSDELIVVSKMQIYDRWGMELYFVENLGRGEGWDGTISGEAVQPGNYIYQLSLVMDDGIERSLSGVIAVVN